MGRLDVEQTFRKEIMNEGLNPSDFNISIEAINQQVNLKNTPVDSRPAEQYNRDTIELYQNFAREHLGFEFNDISIFITALTHRSYVNEHKGIHIEHNERLEFLALPVKKLVMLISSVSLRVKKKATAVALIFLLLLTVLRLSLAPSTWTRAMRLRKNIFIAIFYRKCRKWWRMRSGVIRNPIFRS